ncbi:hypothetical protein D1BOALGB6SA_5970 [Olavius sp. associated proteobacterium Delta 1]|nr:hypothetical protein D1BOALGB6SA_5970 [Olavius sp. associated proteobacterium Delta 1]
MIGLIKDAFKDFNMLLNGHDQKKQPFSATVKAPNLYPWYDPFGVTTGATKSNPLRPQNTPVVLPTKGYHGTVWHAANDIFHNERFILGTENSFWIAESFNEAVGYANGKTNGLNEGLIIEFRISPSATYLYKAKPSQGYWTIKIPNPQPRTYYSMPGIKPVAMYDINKNILRTKVPDQQGQFPPIKKGEINNG